MLDAMASVSAAFGLRINTTKTVVMHVGQHNADNIETRVNGVILEQAREFIYLGSVISDDGSLDAEINRRLGAAAAAFGRLRIRALTNRDLSLHTRVSVYNAAVISVLLYGAETWTIYRRQLRRLESFHAKSLCRILGLSWRDLVPFTEILRRAKATSIESLILLRRLCWAGHVQRMPNNRLPRQLLYGELATGRRSMGGQKLRYKDQLSASLRKCSMHPGSFERLSSERALWRIRRVAV